MDEKSKKILDEKIDKIDKKVEEEVEKLLNESRLSIEEVSFLFMVKIKLEGIRLKEETEAQSIKSKESWKKIMEELTNSDF